MNEEHAIFRVTIKAILKKDDRILILKTPDDSIDFPGGRINQSEVELDLKEVLTRELKEEIGSDVRFRIGDIAFVSKRRYNKHGHDHRIIAVFYKVDYLSGEMLISDEHINSYWINPKDIVDQPDKFISEDEYNQYLSYFKLRST
jgi:ADP-ribose pyrophosphatase YjhB (NUDIX family)